MMIGVGRDLRHVGHTEHLAIAGERLQLAPNLRRDAPTHADIDLIKHQCRNSSRVAAHHQNRE